MSGRTRNYAFLVEHYACKHGQRLDPEHVHLSDSEVSDWMETRPFLLRDLLEALEEQPAEEALINCCIKGLSPSYAVWSVLRSIAKPLAVADVVRDGLIKAEAIEALADYEEKYG